jgi:GTP-binding protein
MSFSVAIVGKPNVGKSSLFNRLCGKRLAIVDDRPGVTRDKKSFEANLFGLHFNFVDTAGWEGRDVNLLPQMMAKQSLKAASEADILFFMIDAKAGIGLDDIEFASLVRKLSKPVVLLVNKSDSNHRVDLKDLYSLGLGEPIFISVHTGAGFDDLYDRLQNMSKSIEVAEKEPVASRDALKICIVGRPNVGKSTLFNGMLQFERSIVASIAGTTRDAIGHYYQHKGTTIELIDTAGLRKRKNISDTVEGMAVGETVNAIRRSHVVILVIDATQPLEKQDLSIAHIAINEGKAVVLIINKMDLIDKREPFLDEIKYLVGKDLHELQGLPMLPICAIKHVDFNRLFDMALAAAERWRFQLNTGQLNKWLEKTVSAHIPPLAKNGKRIRLKYITQTGERPPTFTIFVNVPEELPGSYSKYLANSLRGEFDLGGIPIRIIYKKNKNPYAPQEA